MFKNLGDLSTKRTAQEAVGFYIAYLVAIMLGAMALSLIIGSLTGNADDFGFGVMIGQIVATISCLTLSVLILVKKNRLNTNNTPLVLLALVSGVLAYLGGGLIGLIPAAYLSTR